MKLKKIKVALFSTTRAEFGILRPLIKELQTNKMFITHFFVGGTHTLKKFGKTINEIKKSGIKIDKIFDYVNSKDDSFSIANSMSLSSKKLSLIFRNFNFDFVIVLGDRYELLPIILNAILFKKIIVHIGGGETTQGIIDEQIRNMITKSAHIHFTSSKHYSKKLQSFGENKKRIFNVGSLSVDSLLDLKRSKKIEIIEKFKLNAEYPIVILTYHPTTLEFKISNEDQIKNIFMALSKFNLNLIVTAPNSEIGSESIRKIIKHEVKKNSNYHFYESLGFELYHQLLTYTDYVIGNSSSGIVEVPYYKIPTVNVGIRQKNRYRHKSIIDVNYDSFQIKKAIKKAISLKFSNRLKEMKYEFGNGNAAKKIQTTLIKFSKNKTIMLK